MRINCENTVSFNAEVLAVLATTMSALPVANRLHLAHSWECVLKPLLNSEGGYITTRMAGSGKNASVKGKRTSAADLGISPLACQWQLCMDAADLSAKYGVNVQVPVLEGVRVAPRPAKTPVVK